MFHMESIFFHGSSLRGMHHLIYFENFYKGSSYNALIKATVQVAPTS